MVETIYETSFPYTGGDMHGGVFQQQHVNQPKQYIWRNIQIDKRNGRILCIDRLLKENKTTGYVYVLQAALGKIIPSR